MHKLSVVILLAAAGVAHADKKPKVSVKSLVVKGALDATDFVATVTAVKGKLVGCYSQASSSGGDAKTSITIDRDGIAQKVALADVTDDSIKWCLALAMSNMRFPGSVDGLPMEATFQLRVEGASSSGAFATVTGTNGTFDDDNIYGGLLGTQAGTWGTGGSGFGPGASKSKLPSVSLGQSGVTGDLDKAIIRRYVKRNIQKIQYCYEKQLLAKPTLKGTVTVAFTIAPDGKVESSVAHGMDTEVEGCVAQVIKGIEFPKPKGGGLVAVNYPFTFTPAGSKQP